MIALLQNGKVLSSSVKSTARPPKKATENHLGIFCLQKVLSIINFALPLTSKNSEMESAFALKSAHLPIHRENSLSSSSIVISLRVTHLRLRETCTRRPLNWKDTGPRHTVEFQYASQWRTDTLAKKIHGRHNVEYLTRHTGEKT